MSTRLGDLVERLGGRLIGDADKQVVGIAPLSDADASHITFLSNPKFRTQAAQTRAAALILSAADDEVVGPAYLGARIVAANPYAYFARAAQYFALLNAHVPVPGIHSTAFVDPEAQVSASASIGPHAAIEAGAWVGEDCVIGAGCVIGRNARVGAKTQFHPRVTFLDGCRIGERGIVHSGAVIGADGFGFANESGKWIKIPQTGAVTIGDDVEIGANTTIDRGALADTVIEDGRRCGQCHHRQALHVWWRRDGAGASDNCRQRPHFVGQHGIALDKRTGAVHRFLSAGEKRGMGKICRHRAQFAIDA